MIDAVSWQAVPQGDWFCPDCRPRSRSSRLTSRQQHPVYEEEDEEDLEEHEEMESADEDELEDASDEEVVVRYDGKYFALFIHASMRFGKAVPLICVAVGRSRRRSLKESHARPPKFSQLLHPKPAPLQPGNHLRPGVCLCLSNVCVSVCGTFSLH